MNKIVIYGCGNVGKAAYMYLKDKNEILFLSIRTRKKYKK